MKIKIEISSIQQFFLILSIFLYPFIAFSHTLYLVPQFLLILVTVFKLRYILDAQKIFLALFGVMSFSIAFFIESNAVNPNYDLPIKLAVNVITLIILSMDVSFYFKDNILKQLRVVAYVWLFIIMYTYMQQGLSSFSSIIYTLVSNNSLDSSQLYGAAAPLEDIFLTKNISSMLTVAVFAIYLYLASNFNKKVNNYTILMFFVLTLVFLSRQGIMSFLIIYFLYKYSDFGKVGKVGVIFSGLLSIFYLFTKLFNLNNSGDGASQRIELWKYFFSNFDYFFLAGVGQNKLNDILTQNIGIDNFHMFFMNQIGVYGVFHFIAFTLFLILAYNLGVCRNKHLLVAAYFLNVLFQTFGYEFGNLFLFIILFAKINPPLRVA